MVVEVTFNHWKTRIVYKAELRGLEDLFNDSET